MKIHSNSFLSYASSLFEKNTSNSLILQHKKILIITTIAFGFLAALYAVSRFFYAKHDEKNLKELKENSENNSSPDTSNSQPLENSKELNSGSPLKDDSSIDKTLYADDVNSFKNYLENLDSGDITLDAVMNDVRLAIMTSYSFDDRINIVDSLVNKDAKQLFEFLQKRCDEKPYTCDSEIAAEVRIELCAKRDCLAERKEFNPI